MDHKHSRVTPQGHLVVKQPEQAALQHDVELLGTSDWRAVGAAVERLAAAGDAGMRAVLAGLAHPNPRVRRGCADFFDHHGTDVCVEALWQLACSDPIAYVRRAALHSLGCQRCKPSPLHGDLVSILIDRALHDPNARVRREAIAGLSFHPPDGRAASALASILHDTPDPHARRLAHQALRLHDPAYRRETDERAKANARARDLQSHMDTSPATEGRTG
jgi:hypothetical protein